MSKKKKPEPFRWDEIDSEYTSPSIAAYERMSDQLDWIIRLLYDLNRNRR